MPFDGKQVPDLKTFTPGHDGLRQLSYLLRHPEFWLKRFTWDFTSVLRPDGRCGTAGCALGIAQSVWNIVEGDNTFVSMRCDEYGELFGMTASDVNRIFFTEHGKPSLSDVTPIDVADAIDRYLDRN